MNNRIIVKLMILSFLVGQLIFIQVFALDIKTKDELVISQALQKKFSDGGFMIVYPNNRSLWKLISLFGNVNLTKKALKEKAASANVDIDKSDIDLLLSNLIKRNKKLMKLPLKSSPENGYIVDYSKKFERYFTNENIDGWEKLYGENPKAHGIVNIALPAYDEKLNLALVCIETNYNFGSGSGFLILYIFNNDKLRELARQRIWHAL